MLLVILESPFAGDVERNVTYARRCVRNSLLNGEAPIASHLLYTQKGILDDNVPEERKKGIEAGWEWIVVADKMVVYTDYGISPGMEGAMDLAQEISLKIEYRKIGKNP